MKLMETISRQRNVGVMAGLVPLITLAVLALESGLEGTVVQISASEIDGEFGEFAFDGHGGLGYVIGMTLLAVLGLMITTRRTNPIGAVLTLAVLVDALGAVFAAYGYRSIIVGGLPGGVHVGLIGSVFPVVLLMLVVPGFILVFPTGRLRSPRWRWVLRLAVLASAYLIVGQLLAPLVLGLAPNPIRAPWSVTTADSFLGVGWTAWLGVVALATTSLIWRIVDGGRWLRARAENRRSELTTASRAP